MDRQKKRRRFKKRYIIIPVLIILGGLLILLHFASGMMSQSVAQQLAYFENAGKSPPVYEEYEINDRNINYAEWENPDPQAPVIMMFHGSPGSLDNFLIYLADDTLRQSFSLISFNRPGYGGSNGGKTIRSLQKEAACYLPMLEKYRDQKVILIGHSYGGPIIARLAMDYPELVDGLSIVAGSVDPDLEPANWWRYIINWWGVRWILPSNMAVSNEEILPLKKELTLMVPLWEKITCKTIVVQGTKDKLVPSGNAYFLEKMINPDLLELDMIDNGSHFILWTKKDRIKASLMKLNQND